MDTNVTWICESNYYTLSHKKVTLLYLW